jgi:hypothetical protein
MRADVQSISSRKSQRGCILAMRASAALSGLPSSATHCNEREKKERKKEKNRPKNMGGDTRDAASDRATAKRGGRAARANLGSEGCEIHHMMQG